MVFTGDVAVPEGGGFESRSEVGEDDAAALGKAAVEPPPLGCELGAGGAVGSAAADKALGIGRGLGSALEAPGSGEASVGRGWVGSGAGVSAARFISSRP